MTPPQPDPQIPMVEPPPGLPIHLGNHVAIPLALANKLFACYYGYAPRAWEGEVGYHPPPGISPPGHPPPPTPSRVPPPPSNPVPLHFTPLGYAARRAGVKPTPEPIAQGVGGAPAPSVAVAETPK